MDMFTPQLEKPLLIGAAHYAFLPHQMLPDEAPEVAVIEGQEAFVYPLRQVEQGTLWALKVMKPSYQSASLVQTSDALTSLKDIPGFFLGNRVCLTYAEHSRLLVTYPALEFAMLLPWLPWKTWTELVRTPKASAHYTRLAALGLARATATALWELEQRGYAHTDLAGSNLMYTPDWKRIELLDLEGLYVPDTLPPRRANHGSFGYQHRRMGRYGQWSPEGDRFAGAILLTEILTWWSPVVRAQTPELATSLFHRKELQERGSKRWQAVRDILCLLHPDLVTLFDQAWMSSDLTHCPDFNTWLTCLEQVKHNVPRTLRSHRSTEEERP